jgi:acetylornithine deacetylase/succinyl-diaminopimelate desuccinylase-like protein
LRQLLSRLEDEKSGEILPHGFYVDIPPARRQQAKAAGSILGDAVFEKFPFAGRTRPIAIDPTELILNRTWRPQLAVIGIDGLPAPQDAGNVLLPYTTAKLSLRLPPTLPGEAMGLMKRILTEDPPGGAEVTFEASPFVSQGWNAPEFAPWLEQLLNRAGEAAFGHPPAYMGEGGSIPFMGMLGKRFPQTQFVITGVLGPHSNAHGPNEFLHIPTGKRVAETIAHVLAGHLRHQ